MPINGIPFHKVVEELLTRTIEWKSDADTEVQMPKVSFICSKLSENNRLYHGCCSWNRNLAKRL